MSKKIKTLVKIINTKTGSLLDECTRSLKINEQLQILAKQYPAILDEEDIEFLEKNNLIDTILNIKYAVFVDYANKHGSIKDIKARDVYIYNGKQYNIGNDLNELRRRKRLKKLSDAVIKFFARLGIVWKIRDYNRVAVLESYCHTYRVTIKDIAPDATFKYKGHTLNVGVMVSNIKNDYHRGLLTDKKQIDRLNKLGIEWRVRTFENRIAPLRAYYNQYGSIFKIKHPEVYLFEGKEVAIGNLVSSLRREYWEENLTNALTNEEVKELNKLGMNWGTRKKKPNIDEFQL